MWNLFNDLTNEEKKLIHEVPLPEWFEPMLATLTNDRFSDPGWIYEPKFDGERALTFFSDKKVKIFSRNKHALNMTYPDLVGAYKNPICDNFIIDGEIVAFDEKGITSFSQLQKRLGLKEISLKEALKTPVYYYIFDILYLNGYDLRKLPLKSRKHILEQAIVFEDPLRPTEFIVGTGEDYYRQACDQGWEGIIAKQALSPYQGRRSTDWLKFKCHKSQELVIIGYTQSKGHRNHFGALLVGYYQHDKLFYAGKVGTGFTEELLAFLKKKMDKHISSVSSIEERIKGESQITWLKPVLVGEFGFTEWTRNGKLRHPRFKGLREDKAARDVVKEEPQ